MEYQGAIRWVRVVVVRVVVVRVRVVPVAEVIVQVVVEVIVEVVVVVLTCGRLTPGRRQDYAAVQKLIRKYQDNKEKAGEKAILRLINDVIAILEKEHFTDQDRTEILQAIQHVVEVEGGTQDDVGGVD